MSKKRPSPSEKGVSLFSFLSFLLTKYSFVTRKLPLPSIEPNRLPLGTPPLSERLGGASRGGGEAFLLQLQSRFDTRLNVLHIRSRLKPIYDVTVSINEELREVPLDTRVFCIVRIVCFKLFI